jgi:hypothetical protein
MHFPQTGEQPTKRKNKAFNAIKTEMEEKDRLKKRAGKSSVCVGRLKV